MKNDFDVSIIILTDDNDCIYVDEFDPSIYKGIFIMLTNDVLNPEYGDDDTIYLSHYYDSDLMEEKLFQEHYTECFESDLKYINHETYQINIEGTGEENFIERDGQLFSFVSGYKMTKDIMLNADKILTSYYNKYNDAEMKLGKDEYIPAIMYAYNTIRSYNGKSYHGYIPAIGQLIYIFKHINELNYWIYDMIGESECGNTFYIPDDKTWWSSTQFDKEIEWIMDFQYGHNCTYAMNKRYGGKRYVLPLFKLER